MTYQKSNSMEIPISKLSFMKDNPFNLVDDKKLSSIANSIKENGLTYQIIVMKSDDKYTIIDGRSRVKALQLLGVKTIFCDVREIGLNHAKRLIVDLNLERREEILPSERAKAYKMKLDAIKSQGQRNDLTCGHNVHKLKSKKSREVVAETETISYKTLERYIRLNNLTPELLQKVDKKSLALVPAEKISFLTIQEQEWLFDNLSREEHFGISVSQANLLKKESQKGTLTYDFIDNMLVGENRKQLKAIKLDYKDIAEYFEPDTPPEMCIARIKEALELHRQMTAGNKKTITNDEKTI